MVSYMWGRDVADALLATEAVSEDCEAVTRALRDRWDGWNTWPKLRDLLTIPEARANW